MVLENNKYWLSNGVDPLEICKKYDCPVYVYDSAIIKRQYDRLVNAFDVKSSSDQLCLQGFE